MSSIGTDRLDRLDIVGFFLYSTAIIFCLCLGTFTWARLNYFYIRISNMFAVIETGGKQYLIKTGDTLKIEKLEGEAGNEVVFDKVLLLAKEDGSDVKIGTPYLDGVTIAATLEEQGRGRKLRVVKFKRKVRYKRVIGHRQHFSKVKVKEVK